MPGTGSKTPFILNTKISLDNFQFIYYGNLFLTCSGGLRIYTKIYQCWTWILSMLAWWTSYLSVSYLQYIAPLPEVQFFVGVAKMIKYKWDLTSTSSSVDPKFKTTAGLIHTANMCNIHDCFCKYSELQGDQRQFTFGWWKSHYVTIKKRIWAQKKKKRIEPSVPM